MAVSIDDVLGRLQKVRRSGAGWQACCPAHNDRNPSLSVGQGKGGQILLNCFGPCSTEEVCEAMGLKMKDLMSEVPATKSKPSGQNYDALVRGLERSKRGALGGTWSYFAADGGEVMQVLRFDLPGDEKKYGPIHQTAAGWVSKKPEIDGGLPLYRVNDLGSESMIFVVEGEKCVDSVCRIGLRAVTSALGANAAKLSNWQPLAGLNVTILPDRDAAGNGYSDEVKSLLLALSPPAEVRIVNLENPDGKTPAGFDVFDWLNAVEAKESFDAKEALLAMAAAAPIESRPPIAKLLCMDSVQAREVNWLWPNRFASGKVNILMGDPGTGKSMLTMDLAARVSAGKEWPDGRGAARQGSIILMSAEDDPEDTIKPRLDRAGADCSKIHLLQMLARNGLEKSVTLRDLDAIRDALETVRDARLLIIDPVGNYLAGTDAHKDAEVRQLLTPLVHLAAEFDVAVVLVTHMNKAGGTNAVYRGMGSLAFVALSRTAWLFAQDPDSKNRRTLSNVKTNVGPDQSGLACSFQQDGTVIWETDAVDMSASDTLMAQELPRNKTGHAIRWLQEVLANGPKPASEIEVMGKAAGHTTWSIRSARDNLQVYKTKAGFSDGWTWALPNKGEAPTD